MAVIKLGSFDAEASRNPDFASELRIFRDNMTLSARRNDDIQRDARNAVLARIRRRSLVELRHSR